MSQLNPNNLVRQGYDSLRFVIVQMTQVYCLQGTKSSGAFPLPKPRAVSEAICGAPAQAQAADAEQKAALQNGEANADVASASDWEVCI